MMPLLLEMLARVNFHKQYSLKNKVQQFGTNPFAEKNLVTSHFPCSFHSSVNMADKLARMPSRVAERLTTQVMTTVESIPSSSAVELTAAGSLRVEMELKSLFSTSFSSYQ